MIAGSQSKQIITTIRVQFHNCYSNNAIPILSIQLFSAFTKSYNLSNCSHKCWFNSWWVFEFWGGFYFSRHIATEIRKRKIQKLIKLSQRVFSKRGYPLGREPSNPLQITECHWGIRRERGWIPDILYCVIHTSIIILFISRSFTICTVWTVLILIPILLLCFFCSLCTSANFICVIKALSLMKASDT